MPDGAFVVETSIVVSAPDAAGSAGMELKVDFEPMLDGPSNMARDVELFEFAERGQPGCRVYSWDGPWVSLGRFQRPEDALLDPESTCWVVRPTGGKAVLHGHDVTAGLALPLAMLEGPDSPLWEEAVEQRDRVWVKGSRPSVKKVYTLIARPLVTALRACGLPAALAADTQFAGRGQRVADCFAHVSPNDIVDERTGAKVCGCALRLSHKAVLVQASIPARPPIVEPQAVIRQAASVTLSNWDVNRFPAALNAALGRFLT